MTHRGTGLVPDLGPSPVGTDYVYTWINLNYGLGIVPSWVGVTGGPQGYYLDWGPPAAPPTTTTKLWDGTTWRSASDAQTWDGSIWWDLVGARAWDGATWWVL